MKKIFLFIFSVFIATSLFSQTLTEGFDGMSFPPTGWQNIQVIGSGVWNRVTAGVNPTCNPHSGVSMAHFNSYNFAVGTNALLITPSMNFTGTMPHVFSFWMYADAGWVIYQDSVGIYYNSSPSLAGAHHLETISRLSMNDAWYKHSYLLPSSLSGNYYFIFRGYSQYGNNMFLDDVNISIPAAEDVSAVSIVNDAYLTSGTLYCPQVSIKNTGLNTVSGSVTFEGHDYTNTQIYTSTKPFTNLISWNDSLISFDSVALPNPEAIYYARAYITLTGDLDPSNDTIEKTFYTYTHNRQNVLLEVGTGTWCQYCPGAALGADDLVTNGKHVAVVENHNGDAYSYTSSDARNTYYGITGYPTAIFDGIRQLTGGDHTTSLYTSYLPIYEYRYDIKTAFGLTIGGISSGNNYNISVIAERYGETPFANSNLVLHLALTQSHLQVSWQGQTHLEYVSRIMVPDANGTAIDLSSTMQVTVPLPFVFNPAWGGSIANHDFELVAWIQDLNTREVIAAQKYDLADIITGINEHLLDLFITSISPNPVKTGTTISFYLQESAHTTVEIYNMSGQLVKTIVDIDMGKGPQHISWDVTNNKGNPVGNGLYLCKIKSGKNTGSVKLVVTK